VATLVSTSSLDSDLRHDILDAIDLADEVGGSVGVKVEHGVVTLTGDVDRVEDVAILEQVIRRVYGVGRIRSELRIDTRPG
jgi:osmotically-inducible protein OsmY